MPALQPPALRIVGISACYLPGMDYVALGRRLKDMRKAAGKSMKDVAAAVDHTYQWVDHVEAGRRKIQLHDLEAIAPVLNRRLVLDLVPTGSADQPKWLTTEEEATITAYRNLSASQRDDAMKMLSLLLRAREGATAAAISVLERLQRVETTPPPPTQGSVGDPEE